MMTRLTGSASGPHGGGGRVVVLAGGRAVAETPLAGDGTWALEHEGGVDWLVVQVGGDRIAAVAARPADGQTVALPPLVTLRLLIQGAAGDALLWLDPVRLDGFPDDLLWALRTHPGGIIDLHVGTWGAGEPELTLAVQPGTYRLSGGTIALHPGQLGRTVAEVVGPGGAVVQPSDGEVVLEVSGDSQYTVRLEVTG